MNDLLRRRREIMGQKVEKQGPVYELFNLHETTTQTDTGIYLLQEGDVGYTIIGTATIEKAPNIFNVLVEMLARYNTYWYSFRNNTVSGVSRWQNAWSGDPTSMKAFVLTADLEKMKMRSIFYRTDGTINDIEQAITSTYYPQVTLKIGYTKSSYLDMTINKFAIYKRVLSDKEINDYIN